MAGLNFYARDLYPETGFMETSLLSVPDGSDQRTLETDEKASETSEAITGGVTKRGMLSTVVVMVAVVLIFGILHKG